MSIHLANKQLLNKQQIEVAVHGPDGATHLILCTGVADLGFTQKETYTFLVGPHLSQRQFVGVVASGALSGIQIYGKKPSWDQAEAEGASNLILIHADFDEGASQVRVRVQVVASMRLKLVISYLVSILAELPTF